MVSTHQVVFVPSGRGAAQCPPNPLYPDGIEIDVSKGKPSCTVQLPYPAPECGHWRVECRNCEMTIGVTAAGRPDDPTKVTFDCRVGAKLAPAASNEVRSTQGG